MRSSRIGRISFAALVACLAVLPAHAQEKPPGCGNGAPPNGGPFVDSVAPDANYSLDGCYEIDDEDVVRLDEAGRVLWRSHVNGSLGGVRPPHVVHDDDRVYFTNKDGITALDARDGTLRWHTKCPNERVLLAGDVLVAADCGSGPILDSNGHWLFGLAVHRGQILFRTRL